MYYMRSNNRIIYRGFPARMVYLKHNIIIVEIHHSGRKPSICIICDLLTG